MTTSAINRRMAQALACLSISVVFVLAMSSAAGAAWSELPNDSGDTAGYTFDLALDGDRIFTTSTMADSGGYMLSVTSSSTSGPQSLEDQWVSSQFIDPRPADAGSFTDPRFFREDGKLCFTVASDPFELPDADYKLIDFCRANGVWTRSTTTTPLAQLDARAVPDFDIVDAASGPVMIYAVRNAGHLAFRAAVRANAGWQSAGAEFAAVDGATNMTLSASVVDGVPYAATQIGAPPANGDLRVSAFKNGAWSSVGAPITPPASTRITDFDIAANGGSPLVAWSTLPIPQPTGTAGYEGSLYVSRFNASSSAWEPQGGDINGGETAVASIAADEINGRPAIAWSDFAPDPAGTGFDLGRLRFAVGDGAGSWQEQSGSAGSIANVPDAISYKVDLTHVGTRPLVGFVFIEASPRARFPVGLLLGDAVPALTKSGSAPPPPLTPPKPVKRKRYRICTRSTKTHRLKCRMVSKSVYLKWKKKHRKH